MAQNYPSTIAVVVDGTTPIRKFEGKDAADTAQEFIGNLPNTSDVDSGRYGIDISDDHCDFCDTAFSSEARNDDGTCPNCGRGSDLLW